MKRIKLQKVVSVLLCLAMLFSAVGCGKSEKEEEKSGTTAEATGENASSESVGKKNTEVVELSVDLAGSNGGSTENVPWFENYLAENLGLVLRSSTRGSGSMQARIASGEIPDVVTFNDPSVMQEAIDAGLLLDLTQYKDQLPAIFDNDLYAPMVKYQTELTGTGAMYGARIGIGEDDSLYKYASIRWDVYADIGYPEVNSMDDFLTVAKQMQDACPKTPEGEDNYAFILFPEWDGASIFLAANYYYVLLGYEEPYFDICTIKSDGSEEPHSMLEDNGIYYDALKFLFKANQLGLIDPDSPTLTWDEASVKYYNGQALIAPWDWFRSYNSLNNNLEDGIGYEPFLANAFTLAVNADSFVGSSNQWCYTISANAENLDAALKYLNWMYSYEGTMVMDDGPENVLWKYDENGVRVLTEEGKRIQKEGIDKGSYEMPGGGTLNDLAVTNSYSGNVMLGRTIYPGDGQMINIGLEYQNLEESKLAKDWYRVNGEFNITDYSKVWDGKSGSKLVKRSPAFSFKTELSNDAQEILANIEPVLNTASWKMVFAENEVEFESLWKNAQEDCEKLGVDQVVEEIKEIWNNATNLSAQYFD